MRGFLMAGLVLLSCAVSMEAQTILCESVDGGPRECRVGSSGLATLVTELSEGRCFEGTTYGTRSAGVVWVDRGCRGRFTLRNAVLGARRLVCESQKGERQVCPAEMIQNADPGTGVYLARQLGATVCADGETWGYDPDRDQIWVDHGCRGEFVVGARADPNRRLEPLDGLVVCESGGRRMECQADTTGGVRIIRPLSEAACGFGRQWGFDTRGVWVSGGCRAEFAVRGKPKPALSTVTCQSVDTPKVRCAVETRYGVALLRQVSEKDCVLGKTWDFDELGVWVSDGCHAQFALGGFRLPAGAVPQTATKMICESTDNQRKLCAADASRGAGLLRQISETDCVLNHTWGYGRDGVWVAGGCRAEFVVAH
jgi:hypothetical protein